jgi:HD-GYP domain-containing protein (c-di-GMP phosphodiesterase class II)
VLGETVAGATFLAIAAIVAVLLPAERALAPGVAVLLVLAYALAVRVKFEVHTAYTAPTQLVLVPMLFLLPTPSVPLLVAAGRLLGELPDYLRGRRHPEREVVALGDSWHVLGPVLVLVAAGAQSPAPAHWPIYLLALGAQFTADLAVSTAREWFELSVPPRTVLGDSAWICVVDALLSPIGFLAALAGDQGRYGFLLALPLLPLLAFFARERQDRLEKAIELRNAYRGTTMLLGDLIESGDEYTGFHSRTVVSLSLLVADALGLDAGQRRNTEFAALLHDIGKLAVPEEILNKPGPLDAHEWAVMKRHTIEGERMLDRVGGVLADVGRIVRCSHEHRDGGAYPDGMAGEAIPIEARIVSCCDAFNAMTTDRPYRRTLSTETALFELRANRGTQFDPAVADTLIAVLGAPREGSALPTPEPAI